METKEWVWGVIIGVWLAWGFIAALWASDRYAGLYTRRKTRYHDENGR